MEKEDKSTQEEVKDLNEGVEAILNVGNKVNAVKNGTGFIIIGAIVAGIGLLLLLLELLPLFIGSDATINITNVIEYITPIAIGIFCITSGIKSLRKNKK